MIASRLGKSPPDLNTNTYYPVCQKFLGQLQLELDAKNGLQKVLDDMSLEGSGWLPLVGPADAITPILAAL